MIPLHLFARTGMKWNDTATPVCSYWNEVESLQLFARTGMKWNDTATPV